MAEGVRAAVSMRTTGRVLTIACASLVIATVAGGVQAALAHGAERGPALAIFYVLVALALASVAVIAALSRFRPTDDSALDTTMSVTDGALVLSPDGAATARRIPKEHFAHGLVIPSANGPGARLSLAGRRGMGLEAWVTDRAGARALLSELGLSAGHRPHTFAFFLGLGITVGLDGIVIAWPLLRRKRFIPYANITNMVASDTQIRFDLAGGGHYEVETGMFANGAVTEAHRSLVERIADARAAYAASEHAEPVNLLARAGRSNEAWVRELRTLCEVQGALYRAASLPVETLVRIAADPTEAEELRVGAALALRGANDDDARARLRVAAEASASPRVRVALAASAEDLDDTAMAEALVAKRAG